MFARIRVALVLLVVAAAEPAWSDLYTVGVGAGCTHATVQAAVDAAVQTAETDTILVARNTTYNAQAISIENQSLTVIGGVATCTNFLPDGRTTLSGAGGAAAPVISIRGSGNVSISRINLTGGDNPDPLNGGGGLFFHGSGVVRLDDMNIINNQGGHGGGLYARGTSSAAELIVGANVLISNNTASINGGGIAAREIQLTMTSPESAVFLNTALGDDTGADLFGGDGGGIHCMDCQARIATATPLGTIFLNTAYGKGGGLAVVGEERDARAVLYTSIATRPLVIYGNQAGERGGGVYVQSDFEGLPPPEFNNGQVHAWHIIIRGNTAPAGAAVFLKGHDDFNGESTSEFELGFVPGPGVLCAAENGPCNRITGNVAQDLQGVPSNGAILEDATAATRFRLFHVLIDENVGRSVLRQSSRRWPSIIQRCLLTRNTVSEELIQHVDEATVTIDHCTIAGNEIGGAHVIRAGDDIRIGHSIIWQPGKKALLDGSGGQTTVANLLVNDIDGLPPQVDISSTTNPGFMSAATGDYHLRPDSIAVDFAQYAFDPSLDIPYDLDWGPREVDLPEVPNEFGPRDLGAYEMPAIPDLIFKDGFETGGLTVWASAATDGGDLSVAQVSAMDGTWGLRGIVDDTAGLYVQDDAPWSEPYYRARFYFDTNGFDPGETAGSRRTRIFLGFTEAPQRRVFALVLRRINGQYSLMGRARLDDNSQADTGFVPIADGPHYVEIEWARSPSPDAHDGWLGMWIDGTLVGQVQALDNHQAVVDFVRLGALSVKQAATGTLHWDAFESRRWSYIGPVP